MLVAVTNRAFFCPVSVVLVALGWHQIIAGQGVGQGNKEVKCRFSGTRLALTVHCHTCHLQDRRGKITALKEEKIKNYREKLTIDRQLAPDCSGGAKGEGSYINYFFISLYVYLLSLYLIAVGCWSTAYKFCPCYGLQKCFYILKNDKEVCHAFFRS